VKCKLWWWMRPDDDWRRWVRRQFISFASLFNFRAKISTPSIHENPWESSIKLTRHKRDQTYKCISLSIELNSMASSTATTLQLSWSRANLLSDVIPMPPPSNQTAKPNVSLLVVFFCIHSLLSFDHICRISMCHTWICLASSMLSPMAKSNPWSKWSPFWLLHTCCFLVK